MSNNNSYIHFIDVILFYKCLDIYVRAICVQGLLFKMYYIQVSTPVHVAGLVLLIRIKSYDVYCFQCNPCVGVDITLTYSFLNIKYKLMINSICIIHILTLLAIE